MIDSLISSYNFKEALEEIKRLEEIPTLSENQFAYLMSKKALILTRLGFFEEAISLAHHTINLFGETILSLEEKYNLHFLIIESLWQSGQFEESLLMIERIENKIKFDQSNLNTELKQRIDALLLLNKSSIYCFIDLKKSSELIDKTLEFTEEIDNEILLAQSLTRKGKILTYQGKLIEAVNVREKS